MNRMSTKNEVTREEVINLKTLSDDQRYNIAEKLIEQHIVDETEEAEKLKKTLKKNYKALAINDVDIGKFDLFTMTIEYYGKIINQNSIPIPVKYKDKVNREIQRLLEAGVIRESNSPFNNSILIVEKKIR